MFTACPNYFFSANSTNSTPDDTLWINDAMWGLKGTGTNGINAEAVWDITKGASSVTVGVMDSGIQADHPDLKNRISTAGLHRDFTVEPTKTVSNAELVDPNGHGTHVAGIIGAQGNNKEGVSGVCWDVRLVSLRVFDEYGGSSSAYIAKAIHYAASENIPILNLSGGGYIYDIREKTLLQAALENYKGLFVCAAGNGNNLGIGIDNDTIRFYPSDFSRDQEFSNRVISVGAIDNSGNRAEFSNYGEKSVNIYAPGKDILSTYPQGFCTGETRDTSEGTLLACECKWSNKGWIPNNTKHVANAYHSEWGTSMAAPFVTGVAALLLSVAPELTATQLKQAILGGSDEITINTPDGKQTVKKLNAYKSLLPLVNKDEDGYYIEKIYQNYSMENNISVSTRCLRSDGSYDILYGTGIIGGFNGISVSLCDMLSDSVDYTDWTFYESELIINVQGVVYGGCYIYDTYGNYIDVCTYSTSDNALHVPLANLLQMKESSFVLMPEVTDSGSMGYTVSFTAENVYLNLCARRYI